MIIEEAQGKIHPGFGVCIYCGSDGGAAGLCDEHVVPYSLNGNCIIKDACCVSCQNKIDPADRYLGKALFYHLRLHIGAQTRKPKDRPSTIKTKVSVGTEEIFVTLPRDQSPFSLALPVWGLPGALRGASIDAPFSNVYVNMFHYVPDNMRSILGIGDDVDYSIWATQKIKPDLFARAIAKIGYCYMVMWHGLKGFRPLLLPKVIIGKSSAVPYFVGAPVELTPPPAKGTTLHDVKLGTHQVGQMRLRFAAVRLFANMAYKESGMPIYMVITGASPL